MAEKSPKRRQIELTAYLIQRGPTVRCTVCRHVDAQTLATMAEVYQARGAIRGIAEWLAKPEGGGYPKITFYMVRTHLQERHWERAAAKT